MLLTMQTAIERAIEREDKKPQSTLLTTSKAEWSGLTVKEALAKPEIQKSLVKARHDAQIYFPDTLTPEELSADIDRFVTSQLTELINRDFLIREEPAPKFTKEEIAQYTGAADITYSLNKTVKQLQDNPYKPVVTRQFLPALIALENKKKPDFGLQFSTNYQFVEIISEWVESGKGRARLVHLTDDASRTHTQYIDCKRVDGKHSVIWIDSVQVAENYDSFYEFKGPLKALAEDMGKEVFYGAVALNNQSTEHGCPIFAINAAKQAYKDRTGLDAIHLKNVENQSKKRVLEVDELLPARFMKHTQSSQRMYDYICNNDEAYTTSVNTKNKILDEYRAQHTLYAGSDKGTYMRSIYHKRLEYLTELQTALGITPT